MLKKIKNSLALQDNRLKIGLFFLAAFAIYFSFGLYHIGKFVTADEHLWVYKRIPHYWKSVLAQEWRKTNIHEKPGITLAIISGVGLIKHFNPTAYLREMGTDIKGTSRYIESMLSVFRIPILFFNGLFSIFFYWVLKKITGKEWTALWSAILILLSPSLLGMSQIINADSLIWTFSTATILSFIVYLEKNDKKFLALTAFFLGLSMLTKFTATILMPFLFIMAGAYYLEKTPSFLGKKEEFSRKILKISVGYFLIILGSLVVFAILLPASFFKVKQCFYAGTIGYSIMPLMLLPIFLIQTLLVVEHFWLKNKITISFLERSHKIWSRCSRAIYLFLAGIFLVLIINYFFGHDFLRLEKVPFDARQGRIFKNLFLIKKILLEFRPVVFTLAPVVLFSCIYLWIKVLFSDIREKFLVFVLSLFILVYNIAVIQQGLLNILRYSLIIYPAFSILAAIGLQYLMDKIKTKRLTESIFTLTILILSFSSLWQIKPYYFNYANFLLPKKYIVVDSWGYGGYEAAMYLNSLPEAEKKIIWTDYFGVCEFFKGTCLTDYSIDQSAQPIDFFVLTQRGRVRYYQNLNHVSFIKNTKHLVQLETYYEDGKPIWKLEIDNRPKNYVKIFSNELRTD
jgi:4-amino-4-deoxy-L-arabinose transferase-like glycosyltransferase